jgi:hypothetical protein
MRKESLIIVFIILVFYLRWSVWVEANNVRICGTMCLWDLRIGYWRELNCGKTHQQLREPSSSQRAVMIQSEEGRHEDMSLIKFNGFF